MAIVGTDWSREEVEAIVADYFNMLADELSGRSVNKAQHRRHLAAQLHGRSEQSIEFKHANISAVLIDSGFAYIEGYKPRRNYQRLLAEVVTQRISEDRRLHDLFAIDVDRQVQLPEVNDILNVLKNRPVLSNKDWPISEQAQPLYVSPINYLEREARNQALGMAGECFVLRYEAARLIADGQERLAAKIEHTSQIRGDQAGFDILSFDSDGRERLIEVKTTKYGEDTPFFLTRNEVVASVRHGNQYHLYRIFSFCRKPKIYILKGALGKSCKLEAKLYSATPA